MLLLKGQIDLVGNSNYTGVGVLELTAAQDSLHQCREALLRRVELVYFVNNDNVVHCLASVKLLWVQGRLLCLFLLR